MSTLVPGPVVRQVGLDSFECITDAQVLGIDQRAGVTFAGDLDAATIAQVREFIASSDDANQAARAHLRALCAAASTDDLETLRAAVCGAIDYLLGETS